MTSSKENTSRASPPTRSPAGAAVNSHTRSPHPRTHSHSLSVGSINPTHRISRRKSSSANASAAVAIALGIAAAGNPDSASSSKRSAKPAKPAFPSSLPDTSGFVQATFEATDMPLVEDHLESLPEANKGVTKARARRASEGSRLIKGESKRQSGSELKCETCGKGYKHSSCLYKHLWEHTPEWAYTSKLLISKHQQVQLLEAASVLVSMNHDAVESETSSPVASGSSDVHSDRASSLETSPPPDTNDQSAKSSRRESKRFSSNSSLYSQSYQSVFSEAQGMSSSSSSRPYMSHFRQWSTGGENPATSCTSVAESIDDQADLAAAVGLLSCSYGSTPKTGPVMLPADVPPVPPLPAQFLGHQKKADHHHRLSSSGSAVAEQISGSTITGPGATGGYDSFVRGPRRGSGDDVDMLDGDSESRGGPGGRSDEEEEGMFGKMEE